MSTVNIWSRFAKLTDQELAAFDSAVEALAIRVAPDGTDPVAIREAADRAVDAATLALAETLAVTGE